MFYKAFKVELDPNNKQRTAFAKAAGCARFAYNWGIDLLEGEYQKKQEELKNHLEERKNQGFPDYTKKELEEYKKELNKKYIYPSAITLGNILRAKKETDFSWMKQSSKWSVQNSLISLEEAYKRFFQILKSPKSKKKKSKKPLGFPKKKKKGGKDSFTLDNPITIGSNWIKLPRIGRVRLKEQNYIPEGKPKSATISRQSDRWFVSVQYEVEIPKKEWNTDVLGIDLGIKALATLSDGTEILNSTKAKKLDQSIKRQQRKLARQVKGSNSRKKTKQKIAKLHYRIANSRKDILHKATTRLAKTKPEGIIVLEDLNVSGMLKNGKLARAIANVGMYEFRRQLTYKCEWHGKKIVFVDQFFPSSKLCSVCGCINDNLKLSDRTWVCLDCGTSHNRDLNAAINIREQGKIILNNINTAGLAGINAGGDERSMSVLQRTDRCSSMKPEPSGEVLKCS